MVRLVDDLLDVSRINTGKLTIRREQLMLQDVVNDALELARPFIASQGHTLHVQVPEQAVYLVGDATRLAQVISNLLHNAAKYTARGGSISLAAQLGQGPARHRPPGADRRFAAQAPARRRHRFPPAARVPPLRQPARHLPAPGAAPPWRCALCPLSRQGRWLLLESFGGSCSSPSGQVFDGMHDRSAAGAKQ